MLLGNTGIDCSYYNDRFDFGGAYDCAGLCNGDSELLDFCFDSDNDGLGVGQIDFNCSGLIENDGLWIVLMNVLMMLIMILMMMVFVVISIIVSTKIRSIR